MDFYRQIQPKARKEYVCEYCGQKIHKGEVYSYETGKYDGDMFTRKLCLICENILDKFARESRENEFDWWWVDDWLNDYHCAECEHGRNQKNDCKIHARNCPLIREKFKPKEDTENANATL